MVVAGENKNHMFLRVLELEKKDRHLIGINTSIQSVIEFRKLLFKQRLSLGEFFTYMMKLAELSDPMLTNIIESCKKDKVERIKNYGTQGSGLVKKVRVTSEALYDLIESESPIQDDSDERLEDDYYDEESIEGETK